MPSERSRRLREEARRIERGDPAPAQSAPSGGGSEPQTTDTVLLPQSDQELRSYLNHEIYDLLLLGYPEETAAEKARDKISRLKGNEQFEAAKNNFLAGQQHRDSHNPFSDVMGQLANLQKNSSLARGNLYTHISQGMKPERDYIQNYLGERAGYLEPIVQEASEKFLNRTSPGLRAAMAGQGLFQSSARHLAEAQAAAAANREAARDVAKRGMELQRQGEESYQRQFGRHLGAGQAMQKAHAEEGEAIRLNVQAQQLSSLRKQAEEAGDIDRAMQFAHKEQEDEQRLLDFTTRSLEERRNAPVTHLQKIANIKKDIPTSPISSGTVTVPGAPTPPNPLSLAAGILTSGMGREQPVAKKTGGHIKGYAEGGYVGQETPEQKTMREMATIMNRGQGSPEGAYLRALGARQIAGSGVNGGSPLANLGLGMMEGEEARERQRNANMNEHAQAANLHNMIESSRRDQQIMIHEREHKRATEKHNTASLAEDIRHHDLQNTQHEKEYGETRRLHDATIERERAHADYYRSQAGSQSGERTINPKMLTPADKKILEQDALTLKSAPDLLSRLERMKELSSKIHGGGVVAKMPYLNDPLVSGNIPFGKIGQQADIEEFNKEANALIADATAAGGSRWGKAMAAVLEKGKPSISNSQEANNRVIDSMIGLTRDHLESSYFGQEAMDQGIHPAKAKVAFQHYKEALKENPKAAKDMTPFDFINKAYEYGKKPKESKETHAGSDEDSPLEQEIAKLERRKAAALSVDPAAGVGY